MAYTNLTFEDRLNNALLKLTWLKRDFADFEAFNASKFTAQFVADFKAAYETALTLPSDETLTDLGTEKTAAVVQKMEAARNLYQKKIKYFLEAAFGEQSGKLDSFGHRHYRTARASVSGMVAFLSLLEARCEQEAAAILAVGIADTFLAEIRAAKEELAAAYAEQQTHFGNQKDMTQTRKSVFERVDDFVKEVCKVGKIIFEGENQAKYEDYVIYKTRANTKTVTKMLPANSETPVLETEAEENLRLQIENIGETELVFYVNDEPQPSAAGYTLSLNAVTVLTTNTLSVGDYGMLIARNAHPIAGAVRVKVLEIAEEDA
jgi:hypothetical protein